MKTKTVRIYPDRHPRIGDNVVALRTSGIYHNKYIEGYEYTVVGLGNETIIVTGERMPSNSKELVILDGFYAIYEDVIEEVKETILKETHEKVYCFWVYLSLNARHIFTKKIN
ncbi:hypothetical protein PQ478_08885 [Alkalihalophilus pseudofirmus]|uniref:hypothetical protein n=1 Tax=Alkalihalophilus pseudofirmus TaxID=79885 RepID=UPI00259BA9CA|nr:hypothetical protein [Alkalihalophilus pseudofirmus]WEG18585.1 hypothetical protein PQ478_08885 [Alkalihalophilus pseudofirmus]